MPRFEEADNISFPLTALKQELSLTILGVEERVEKGGGAGAGKN